MSAMGQVTGTDPRHMSLIARFAVMVPRVMEATSVATPIGNTEPGDNGFERGARGFEEWIIFAVNPGLPDCSGTTTQPVGVA